LLAIPAKEAFIATIVFMMTVIIIVDGEGTPASLRVSRLARTLPAWLPLRLPRPQKQDRTEIAVATAMVATRSRAAIPPPAPLPPWAEASSTYSDLLVEAANGRAGPPVREHAFVVAATTTTATGGGDGDGDGVDALAEAIGDLDALVEHLVRTDYEGDWDHRGRSIVWMGTECYVQLSRPTNHINIPPPAGFSNLVTFITWSAEPRQAHRLPLNEYKRVRAFVVYGTGAETKALARLTGLLCRLIAADALCEHASIEDGAFPAPRPLPLPVEALERLVRVAGRERTLALDPLSAEQEDVLLSRCHEDIRLIVRFDRPENWAGLPDALRRHRTPSKLSLVDFHRLPVTIFDPLVASLAANRSTTDLHLDCQLLCRRRMNALMSAVEGMRGLRSVGLVSWQRIVSVEKETWELFWATVSRHPTIQEVNIEMCIDPALNNGTLTAYPGCIARSVRDNTVLTRLVYSECQVNIGIMSSQVIPILELNRFRPRFASLHRVRSDSVRRKLLVPALARCANRGTPDLCFRLLREHPWAAIAAGAAAVPRPAPPRAPRWRREGRGPVGTAKPRRLVRAASPPGDRAKRRRAAEEE
jgi:hypothetical protein